MIIPGYYSVRICKMRFREFYRMGGLPFLLQSVIIKIIGRNSLGSQRMKLPDSLWDNIATRIELDETAIRMIDNGTNHISHVRDLFYVCNKTATDTENRYIAGGRYLLLDKFTIGFYSYIWCQNIKFPSVIAEKEVFSCYSFANSSITFTSNFDIGFDPAPEVDSIIFKDSDSLGVINYHADRIVGLKCQVLELLNTDQIIDRLNFASDLSAIDKIKRGLYVKIE